MIWKPKNPDIEPIWSGQWTYWVNSYLQSVKIFFNM